MFLYHYFLFLLRQEAVVLRQEAVVLRQKAVAKMTGGLCIDLCEQKPGALESLHNMKDM